MKRESGSQGTYCIHKDGRELLLLQATKESISLEERKVTAQMSEEDLAQMGYDFTVRKRILRVIEVYAVRTAWPKTRGSS